ncbi:MAG: prepilin-type N-terminal cleavage/methylation domain-containing protein [Akkermansiaceae bacterium]|nr:prepilin-type N-terminal cleavage/methylation domain-containing protein [Akkermansiaceae bacterium]
MDGDRLAFGCEIRHSRAFSLVELLTVLTILAVLATIAIPSLYRLLTASALTVGAREFSNHLVLARTEAISKHALIRFVVATDWAELDGELRRYSLWRWDEETTKFVRTTEWKALPEGIVLEGALPDYLGAAEYARRDPTTIRGDHPVSHKGAEFEATDPENRTVSTQFVEFLPTGAARVPDGIERNLIFVLIEGYLENGGGGMGRLVRVGGTPAGKSENWAQVNVETLTGKVRIYRP